MGKTRKLHLVLMIFWVLMIVPTVTIWQKSILLVLLMSLYANIEATAGAYISSRKKPRKKHRIRNVSNISHRGVSGGSSIKTAKREGSNSR